MRKSVARILSWCSPLRGHEFATPLHRVLSLSIARAPAKRRKVKILIGDSSPAFQDELFLPISLTFAICTIGAILLKIFL